ncbi:HAD-like domain protein [Moelleriella libera RCEF 2490]|uniref:HAD-like domain protein n=1 Tax=Moelleriella libera RCEF 2490 TaxID=1081109 RepID=A0A162IKC8_9HYPO|nr:HAD-like domain protein [Moelleriella libera RCEF 2490]
MRLVFDFDGTITRKDTIGELARSAINSKPAQEQPGHEAAWKQAVHAYLEDYATYETEYQPAESQRTSPEQEKRFLAGLKSVEEASLTRVSDNGLFAGLKRTDLYRMGADAASAGHISVREGFYRLVDVAEQNGMRVNVLSVNWSSAFIAGVLDRRRGIDIVANDVDDEGQIRGPLHTGTTRLTTASDKLAAMRHHVLGGAEHDAVFFFGDSATDLECLLWHSGIVLAESQESSPLLQTLARIGTEVAHVSSLQDDGDKKSSGAGASRDRVSSLHDRHDQKLFWARDFREILDCGIIEQQ